MAAADIFPTGSVFELADADGGSMPFGYGFAAAGGDYQYQIQRWILFTRDKSLFPPRRQVILRKTADATWSVPTTVDKFKNLVKAQFDKTKHFYVKVNCEQRSGIASLPRPMPTLNYLPPAPIIVDQPDEGTAQLLVNDIAVGYVQTFFPDEYRSHEYWVLFNGYSSELAPTMRTIKTPEQFADLMDHTSWNVSATLVTCACTYHKQLPSLLNM